jgi:general secretion pathway protein B
MSFILDALKKLEQEKAARKGGDVNISSEIIREHHQLRRKVKRSVPMSAVLIVFGLMILIGVSGVFLWHKQGGNEKETIAATKHKRIPSLEEDDPVPQDMPMVRSAAPPARPVMAEEAEPAPLPREANRNLQGGRFTAQRPAISDYKARSEEPVREVSGSKGSGITVSGIAWQDAPAARRAVINGDLVQEGAQVGGATVEEILPTRVRFSSAGRRFTVSISGPLVAK